MVSVVSAYPCFGLQLIQTNLILSYFPVKLGRRLCDVSAGVRETSFELIAVYNLARKFLPHRLYVGHRDQQHCCENFIH